MAPGWRKAIDYCAQSKQVLAERAARLGLSLALPVDQLATVLIAMTNGMAVEQLADPHGVAQGSVRAKRWISFSDDSRRKQNGGHDVKRIRLLGGIGGESTPEHHRLINEGDQGPPQRRAAGPSSSRPGDAERAVDLARSADGK